MGNYDINFLVIAIGKYKMFAYPYITSVLSHVPNSHVEIIVDDVDYFSETIHKAKELYGDRFLIRKYRKEMEGWENNPQHHLQTNTIRFLEYPHTPSTSVYIGDIDIIILDSDIMQNHISHSKLIKLPYSNIRRHNSEALTGLHFISSSEEYYNLYTPQYQSQVISMINKGEYTTYDENLLYNLMLEGYGVPEYANKECTYPNAEPQEVVYNYRPQHGLHISLNRPDITHPTKGWGFSPTRNEKYKILSKTPLWNNSLKIFDKDYISILDKINKVIYEL